MRGQGIFGAGGDPVWQPGPDEIGRSRLAAAMSRWGYSSIEELHRASVDDPDWFWPAALADLGIVLDPPPERVRDGTAGHEFPAWFPGGRVNIVTSCVRRHAGSDRPAVVYEGDNGQRRTLTFAELDRDVTRFAAHLAGLGVRRGDRVVLFLPVVPEAVVAFLACAAIGAISVPAFSGYGPEPLAARLTDSEAVALITADGTTRRGKPVQLKEIADQALALTSGGVSTVVVVANTGEPVPMQPGRDVAWTDLDRDVEQVPDAATDANDPVTIIYTSGTTGRPKGIVHSHAGFLTKAALDFGYAFDVQDHDVIVWTADLGWMLGPLLILGGLHFGATIVLVEGAPDHPEPDRLWQVAARNRATVLGIAPTAARVLRAADDGAPLPDLSCVRAFASTGEAWDAPTWHWLFERVGARRRPVLNYSGGTETGGGILSGYTILPHAPAAFCGPLLGMDVAVLGGAGEPVRGEIGELAVCNTWPGMTHGFWRDRERFLQTYWSRWPATWVHGDLASLDGHGYWRLHGRSDDTIKIAGRRVGPAEIESGLIADPRVVEAAVIGVPDPMRGQAAVGFVVLHPGSHGADPDDLRAAAVAHAGRSFAPSAVHVVSALPKTKNGKLMRRAIRARYLGEPEGDLSALDAAAPLSVIPTLRAPDLGSPKSGGTT